MRVLPSSVMPRAILALLLSGLITFLVAQAGQTVTLILLFLVLALGLYAGSAIVIASRAYPAHTVLRGRRRRSPPWWRPRWWPPRWPWGEGPHSGTREPRRPLLPHMPSRGAEAIPDEELFSPGLEEFYRPNLEEPYRPNP